MHGIIQNVKCYEHNRAREGENKEQRWVDKILYKWGGYGHVYCKANP